MEVVRPQLVEGVVKLVCVGVVLEGREGVVWGQAWSSTLTRGPRLLTLPGLHAAQLAGQTF
jgi:hypothetical protein